MVYWSLSQYLVKGFNQQGYEHQEMANPWKKMPVSLHKKMNQLEIMFSPVVRQPEILQLRNNFLNADSGLQFSAATQTTEAPNCPDTANAGLLCASGTETV